LRYGREFDASDATARHVVVNDTFADLAFQGQHAIGKTIQVGGLRGEWYTVIGVVRDIPIAGLISFEPDENSLVTSRVPGHEAAIYFQAEHNPPAVLDVVSDEPVKLQIAGLGIGKTMTMRELQTAARAPAGWFAGVLSALAAAAAIIAVLSLGALTLLNVRQRELEIAARRAVGARRRDIVRLILVNSMMTAAGGTFVGVVLSIAIARAIQMVLPEMRIFDPLVIAATATLLLIASVVAAIIPARAAARIMPAQIHA
jgi:putative ABC transport system permease protein